MTKVVHCKKEDYDIYIGRRAGTYEHFGNPFILWQDGDRDEVISKFRSWLGGKEFTDIEQVRRAYILDNIHTLSGKTLGCWCSPLPCHGDVLIEDSK